MFHRHGFVKKQPVRELHQVEGDTNRLVTIVKVDIENLFAVVNGKTTPAYITPSRVSCHFFLLSWSSQVSVSLPVTYTDNTGSPTVTEEERMVFSAGGMTSLLRNVRSPIYSVPCEYELF